MEKVSKFLLFLKDHFSLLAHFILMFKFKIGVRESSSGKDKENETDEKEKSQR